ncbi:MAG: methylenetetrahydrofolate reductase [Cyanobacteriota bacterium]|nr:methylenetetrahydrofolate reductase [Cyanobacteriota bacterium]
MESAPPQSQAFSATVAPLPQSRLAAAVGRGEFLITAEVTPPKGSYPLHLLEQAQSLRGRVHAVNVTDCNRAMARMSAWAAALLLKQVGIEPIYQLACRDRNRLALQGDLLGAAALGIQNVLALTGDPLKAGDCPDAKAVFELESVRLLRLIQQLNSGRDCNGQSLPDQGTQLFAGAALEPQSKSRSGLLRRFHKKLEMGAQFFQTQMITDFGQLADFMEREGRSAGKPILAGIFLLKSAKNALFINKYLPGVNIPDAIIERLAQSDHPLQEGIQIAAEQIKQARQICQGIHVMAVKAEHLIPQILDEAGIPPL